MTPQEIADSYDSLADHWNSDAFPRSNGIEAHERALGFIETRGYALDIGCGSSGRIIDLLAVSGFSVEGIDISPRMIELAQKRHPDTTFHLADVRDWPFSKQFDFISAWDSIWHLPLKDQASVLATMLRALNKGGVCIFTTGGLDAADEKVDSEMGVPMYYSVLGIPGTLQIIDDNGCICRHLEYDQHPELHLYLIVQRVRG